MIFSILPIIRALCAYKTVGENTAKRLLTLLALLPAEKELKMTNHYLPDDWSLLARIDKTPNNVTKEQLAALKAGWLLGFADGLARSNRDAVGADTSL